MFIGHQKQWHFLKDSFENKKLPHALLFCGQEKIGKKKVAIELAKYINCTGGDKPCDNCRNCLDIERGLFPDFVLIAPPKKQSKIQIAEIRNAVKRLSLKPYSSSLRIALVDRAHLMTADAQGCFLKFLEEPKGDSLIILATEYPETLLPTIRSRIQKVGFYLVSGRKIKKYLQRKGAEEKKAEILSAVCGGKPGVALDLLENPDILEQRKRTVQDFISLSKGDLVLRLDYAKKFFKEPKFELQEVLDAWLHYLRKIFLVQATEDKESNPFDYSLSESRKIISLIQETKFLVSTTNVNPRLAFEILLMEI